VQERVDRLEERLVEAGAIASIDGPPISRSIMVRRRARSSTSRCSRTPKITRSTTSSVISCIRGDSASGSRRGHVAICSRAISAIRSR
jgi:hypothetical protein